MSALDDWRDPLGCQDVNLAQEVIDEQQSRIAELGADNERLSIGVSNCAKTVDQLMTENERLRKELNFYDNKCEFCGSPLGLLHQESCPLCESRADIEELEAENKRLDAELTKQLMHGTRLQETIDLLRLKLADAYTRGMK